MVEMEIGKAKKADFGYIEEKIKKYLLDGSNISWEQFFVARLKGKVVAFGRVIDHGEFFEVASLGVDYDHRKNGIGKEMLSYLVQQARQMDPQKAIYGVTHVPRFVASCGFKRVRKDSCPQYLEYKRKHLCVLDESKISIMKWEG
jgi:N-acetylglutamate synthase-like GNAT family acetyltransferase